ncbi:bifunctional 2-polyprenyl-6-hydroxyphenol methylase/3-demethylubiquinol 3-O-methyltransferase UbiG [Conexibacter sp. DBS9H8]|uniref:class I SAM-dependent methyltransferase n=1 Tax=Conexibacter sp. DBS9H8 TaxID=2937801 RepID=UPI002010307A|nr:class I SAM-dependent methyltransferase [Conexibacter sp. DBS9H8]
MEAALDLFERALRGPVPLQVRFSDGHLAALPVARYLAAADTAERRLLAGVRGPVLDVGCGPGRHLRALADVGVPGLGVDLSPVAVALARARGVEAAVADIFGEIPHAGVWATALVLDGSIGIGGDPQRLLRRLAELLAGDGEVLIELDPRPVRSTATRARIEADGRTSGWFAWAQVSEGHITDLAGAAGFSVERSWRCGERCFASLRRTGAG